MAGTIVRNLEGPCPELPLPARVVGAARRAFGLGRSARTVQLALSDQGAWSARVGPGGAVVRCLAGAVWLTREGDVEDRILEVGASFASDRRGRVALLALGPARVEVTGDVDAGVRGP
jgi:hypothetical protein